MDLISVANLSVGYDGRAVLHGLNFSIPRERITVILGSSGCGKSTLLKSLVGLLPPLEGEIRFLRDTVDYGSERSLLSLSGQIGVLFQNGALLNSFTLYENVALPLRMHHAGLHPALEAEMVGTRLAQVGLGDSASKYPSELSGGMRKRAALARAMILDPTAVFCDEPSAGLDPITAAGLDELMLELNERFHTTFIVITHELRSIDRIADEVLVLYRGGLHFRGSYEDLRSLKDDYIQSFFLKKRSRHD